VTKMRFHTTLGAALTLCLAATALAQTPPAGNIDERVRQQLRLPTEREQTDALMSGDSDLVLLRRTQLFNAHASLDLTHTSNAYLAPDDRIADQFGQAQLGVGFATRIAEKVDVFADLTVVAVRYRDEDSLDYSAASGALGAAMDVGPVTVSAVWQPSMVFDRGFSHRQLTSHRLRLSGSRPFLLGEVTIQPEVHVERAITNPSDYKAWAGGISLTASEPLSQRIPLLAYVTAGYDRRVFDDYFEAFVGVKRKDNSVSAGAGVIWRPLPFGEVRASYTYGHNGSTSDVNRYTAHSGALGLSATLRF
jgi:hypothetical protein